MTAIPKPLPRPDRDSLPYWEGVRAGELRVQKCGQCGTLRWPARAICNRCHSFEAEWIALSGKGRLVSWIRTHQRFHPAFADEVPYVTLLVAPVEQDDIQFIGALDGDLPDPRIGMAMEAVFREADEGETLVYWRVAGEGA